MGVLHFHISMEAGFACTGVLGLWPWVVAAKRQGEPSEEVPKRLVCAVRQLLLGRVGQPRRQLPGQPWFGLLISHVPWPELLLRSGVGDSWIP